MKHWLRIHRDDNVLVALEPLSKGLSISLGTEPFTLWQDVDRGHKVATTHLPANSPVLKYGAVIGHTTSEIKAGEWVHSHNLSTNLQEQQCYRFSPVTFAPVTPPPDREVNVYHRANGEIGICNELWIIPTVGCVNALRK